MSPIWVIMPVVVEAYTETAIADVLAQSVPIRLLIINQGVPTEFRQRLERIAEDNPDRVFLWHHIPPLPSLAATWNRALDFVWETGGVEALVVNNDVRLHPETVLGLSLALRHHEALFVSAVGVTAEQFQEFSDRPRDSWTHRQIGFQQPRGGPDFSCFLISKDGHQKYRFDERILLYTEDLDCHRRYMLGGDGDRIFSINLPYLHYASGTLKSLPPEQRRPVERMADQSRAYYAQKWGGPVNHERYTIPFQPDSDQDGVTTPELQRACTETPNSVSTTES